MKFSSAALIWLATAPTAAAFVVPRPASSRQQHAWVALPSTTEDRDLDLLPGGAVLNHVSAVAATASKIIPKQTAALDDVELSRMAAVQTRTDVADYMKQYIGQSGASIVYSKLVENGVEVVNGFSGGAVLPLLDQFHPSHPRHKGRTPIRWITNSNESSAGHIAEGYGKAMPIHGPQKPVGVVIATSGPGLTNLITPLQDAICDGVPVVALCGQAATNAPKDAFQSAPAVALTTPCTKWSYQIKSCAELPLVIDYAFYVARNGRPGPVFVDLPKDLQNQVLTEDLVDNFIKSNLHQPESRQNVCRLMERRREDGTIYQAIHMGTKGKGLPFELVRDRNNFELRAVPDVQDMYHADFSVTDSITYHDFADPSLTLQGNLCTESAMAQKMMNIIRNARKPVILAGQGCNDAAEELKTFAEALQIPVATTLHALGAFDERSDLALNMVGMHGHPTPNFMFQEADLVINVGSRFDDRITGRMNSYIPAARQAAEEGRGGIIHVDIRKTEHGKQLTPTFFVHSTGKKFLTTMNALLPKQNTKPTITQPWLKRMRELQRDFPVKIPEFPTQHVNVQCQKTGEYQTIPRTAMSMQYVINEMDRMLLEKKKIDDCIFTTGVGVHQMIAAQLITWTKPRQMLSSGSLGTMGVALGYAIGAKLANAGKIVIAVDGDGSFNMTFTELKTLAEEKIPIKIIIMDNDGQMMVEYWQKLFHNNRLLAVRNSANPDYVILAKAFGIKAIYCDAKEDLEDALNDFLFNDPTEPVLFHCRVQRTPCLPLVAPGQPLDDMILEDVEVNVDGMAAPS